MSLNTSKKTMVIHVDPLTFNADIQVLGGNNVQTYNRDTQEYEPDRALVPLVLMPTVEVQDPDNVQTGKQTLTNVDWYEGAPLSDASNQISAGTDYEIGDGTVASFPKYALKCKKNINPNIPIEIYAVATFVDKRRNTEIKVERSISVYTYYYDSLNYSLKIDKPETWSINPLTEVPDQEGYWKHTITAQLYSSTNPVDDANAAYWWEVYEDGKWRAINDDDLSVWIDCKDSTGNFTKTLTFDARMIDRTTSFRAKAAYYEGTRPSVPKSEELRADTSIQLEMPKTLSVEIVQTKGARMDVNLTTPAGYEVVIAYNKAVITGKNHLFQIEWYGRSLKVGSRDVYLGVGRTMEFIPKDKGFQSGFPVDVHATVKLYNGHRVVTHNVGGETTVVTVGGVPVIAPVYN